MKKIVTFIHLLCLAVGATAQYHPIKVKSIDQLPIRGYHANFNPKSDKILLTTSNYSGLTTYDIVNGEQKRITEAQGAGYHPIYGDHHIVYQKKGNMKEWEVIDLETLQTSQVNEKSIHSRYSSSGSRSVYTFNSAETSKNLHEIILISVSGGRKSIQPLGANEDYLSISLSPDHQKVLFRASGIGTFVSDLDGNILYELGNVEFPKWISNEEVLFAEVEDDGHQYLSSDLYITRLGYLEKTPLTTYLEDIPIYPSVAPSKDKIIFHTPKGHLYLIRLSR